ncbi:MAG: hypothetical protein U9P10_10840 [Thermodesulfobacteriota bacterium]|nr:hypothetical protein [Thermodesulfobacteriota bacterium]
MNKISALKIMRGAAGCFAAVLGMAAIIATSGDSGGGSGDAAPPATGVVIDMPADGSAYVHGCTVSFISKLSDPADGETYTYSWISDQDGELGTTTNVTSNALSSGPHEIILTVTDAAGNTVGSDSVNITIGEADTSSDAASNTPPNADITSPSTLLSFNTGETITFEGTGTDAEDGTLTGDALVWSSDRDGGLGTGASLSNASLSEGEHTITLTASDTSGSSAMAFIIITVGSSANAPAVIISSPAESPSGTYEAKAGDTINFIGSASDFDGSPIADENLEWISSRDGKIGTGSVLSLDTSNIPLKNAPLKEGDHTIYLRASGSAGTGQASIVITLVNTGPAADISNPPKTCPDTNALCQTFAPGEWIDFHGTALDSEDGDLSGDSLEWRSHIDGLLGTGERLSINTDNVQALNNSPMTHGEHIITLMAKDSWGSTGTDSIIINIGENTPPVPSITYPEGDYTSPASTGYVIFFGKAEDAEEGSLTSDTLEWFRSDQANTITPGEAPGSGVLTSSVSLDISSFEAGIHTISLVATDSNGEKGVVTRSITVP